MLPASSLLLFLRRFAVALVLVTIVTGVSVMSGASFFKKVADDIPIVKISDDVLTPEKQGKPANYLIIGSDELPPDATPEEIARFGDANARGGARTDTIMVVHVNPATETALLVSLPRDLLVAIPGHGRDKLNAAYAIGGAELLIRTISESFDIPIVHYLEVDFRGFENIVDSIGTVEIYFPTPVRDKFTQLNVPEKGCQELDGHTALNYVRSRHYQAYNAKTKRWIEDPRQDLDRIQRQQYFIRSLGQSALEHGARNITKAFALVNTVGKYLKRDAALDIEDLKLLIRTFRDLNPATVEMTTLPVDTQGSDLVVQELASRPLLERLRDFSIPQSLPKVETPANVSVRVVNGSGVKGRAAEVLAAFVAHGFKRAGAPADAEQSDYAKTKVRYAPGKASKGLLVASYLDTTEVVEALDTLGGDVLVIVGRDYPALRAPLKNAPPPSVPESGAPGSSSSVPGAAAPTTPGTATTTVAPTTTSTTIAGAVTPDTMFVPVNPETHGILVGCP